MANRHNTLTDEVFKNSKYIDMIQRHYGIKNFRKEYPSQYKLLLDIFQTFILVFNVFFSDSNKNKTEKADEARDKIEKLIYRNYENSQKHKYSVRDIKDIVDKRARRLYNYMEQWQKELENITPKNANYSIELNNMIDTLEKEMNELEKVGFDNVVSNDFSYQTNWLKYYTKNSIIISKFDDIYSGKENFIKEYKEYYYNEYGVELTDDDIEELTPLYRLVANANNGLAKVISNYKIENYNINERSSAKYIYKAYLKSLKIDYNDIETFEEISRIFKVALTLLYREVNKKGHFTITEVLDNYDMFSFMISMEQIVEKDIHNEHKDIDKILTDLKEVHIIMNSIEDMKDLDKTIKEYYIPAYNIIKSIIKRKNNMCFVEVS